MQTTDTAVLRLWFWLLVFGGHLASCGVCTALPMLSSGALEQSAGNNRACLPWFDLKISS